ncbi:hypothetical protein FB106_108100 [Synechococcus sp. Ace-Pa]|nr:hypothetical protein FB106_108100 [Synechococcus sp. Ace-Pa]
MADQGNISSTLRERQISRCHEVLATFAVGQEAKAEASL